MIFRTGLSSGSSRRACRCRPSWRLTSNPELGRRIEEITRELDEATRLVRQSIFGLRTRSDGADLRRGILDLCRELAPMLGTTPDVSFSGAIDAALPG